MCVNSASTVLGGAADNSGMVEILWHRRETRRKTENTNIDLQLGEDAVYSTNRSMGYEVDVNSPTRKGGGSEKKTGTIRVYPRAERGFAPVIASKSAHNDDQWFHVKIVARDRQLVVSIDGNVISKYTDDNLHFKKGRIALQHYVDGSEVRFRNVTIKRLAQ